MKRPGQALAFQNTALGQMSGVWVQHARKGWCFLNWHKTKEAVSDRAQIRDLKWPLGRRGDGGRVTEKATERSSA